MVPAGPDGIGLMLGALQAGEPAILHIQWEEFVFAACRSDDEAAACLDAFRAGIARIVALGGVIVLTIHNGMPHTIPYQAAFVAARQIAVDAARLILVHNQASADYIQAQVRVDAGKIRLLPHPSYLNSYESEETAVAGLDAPANRHILLFGTTRAQKGFEPVIEALTPGFLEQNDARLQVSGHGPYGKPLKARYPDRTDIVWDLRYVEDADATVLLRQSACTVMAYKSFLTSGIAHLIVSAGGLMVAPRVQQHLDLLPATHHRFLYRQDDADDLRRAVRDVLGLTPAERKASGLANLAVARALRPEVISGKLAGFYDEARQADKN